MEALNRILKAQAISHGLCKQWTEEWDLNGDYKSLLNKYKRGIDFCFANNYPSHEFIKTHFDSELLCLNHIFIDKQIELNNAPTDTYIVQGESTVKLDFNDYTAAFLWVKDNSKVEITAGDHSRIFIHAYDDCECTIHLLDNARIVINQSSDSTNITVCDETIRKEKKSDEICV